MPHTEMTEILQMVRDTGAPTIITVFVLYRLDRSLQSLTSALNRLLERERTCPSRTTSAPPE